MSDAPQVKSMRNVWVVLIVLICVTAVFAWAKMGVLDLPSVPADVTLESAGLDHLPQMKELDAYLRFDGPVPTDNPPSEGARKVHDGIELTDTGNAEAGLALMRDGIELDPDNLVLTNAYRMVTFRLKRQFLAKARQDLSLTPAFPPHLKDQPIGFLTRLVEEHPSRSAKLSLAMAWVDHMLLFPALEIKAPASVEAVDILTRLIDNGNENYVPALFARGLNHLHRPARLVWPETMKTRDDAAANDIRRCIAIGRKLGAGSKRLQAILAIALGDAYIKTGEYGKSRSWWQIAQNLSHDKQTQLAIRRRFSWHNDQMIDELERELDRSRSELTHPMTDLAMMWN